MSDDSMISSVGLVPGLIEWEAAQAAVLKNFTDQYAIENPFDPYFHYVANTTNATNETNAIAGDTHAHGRRRRRLLADGEDQDEEDQVGPYTSNSRFISKSQHLNISTSQQLNISASQHGPDAANFAASYPD